MEQILKELGTPLAVYNETARGPEQTEPALPDGRRGACRSGIPGVVVSTGTPLRADVVVARWGSCSPVDNYTPEAVDTKGRSRESLPGYLHMWCNGGLHREVLRVGFPCPE